MSYKNELQEILAKSGIKPPIYKTLRVGGPEHTPIWKSTVSYHGLVYESREYHSKKEAEQDAAKVAYESLIGGQCIVVSEPTIEQHAINRCMVIDVENRPRDYDVVRHMDIDIYLVISSGHALEDKIRLSNRKHRIISVPTMQSNGADVGVIVLSTMIRDQYDRLIIISSDKFVLPIPDCLSDIGYTGLKHTTTRDIKIYRSVKQFLNS